MDAKHIVLASDHAGVELKARLVEELASRGHDAEDLGPRDASRVDYPDYARAVAERVAAEPGVLGVLVCGTGVGMAITANKVPGVRAAVVQSEFVARMSRQHNDANVLCLGARVLGSDQAVAILRAWIEAEFEGGRHRQRLDKIAALERR